MFRYPYLDIWTPHSLLCFRYNLKAEPTREADETEDSQWVVVEGLEGREGSADEPVFHILETTARKVLDLLGMKIVEQGIDGTIAAKGILHGGSEFLQKH